MIFAKRLYLMSMQMLGAGVIDLLLGALFAVAFVRTRSSSGMASSVTEP